MCNRICFQQQPCMVGTIIVPILWMLELRLRETVFPSPKGRRWLSWGLVCLTLELTPTLDCSPLVSGLPTWLSALPNRSSLQREDPACP